MLMEMHPQDVRSELRKRFRTIANFERSKNLPSKSVYEVLRGRKSARVSRAIEAALIEPLPKTSADSAAPEPGVATEDRSQ